MKQEKTKKKEQGNVQKAVRYAREQYTVLSEKKYSTIAGTLVFFLIMSVTPFIFWLTLLFGKLDLELDRLFALPIFASVEKLIVYIRAEATGAHKGASVFLLVATLYSSTNFFYHLRRSGEIVYGYQKHKHGLLVRIVALVLMFVLMIFSVVAVAVVAGGAFVFSQIFSRPVELIADYALLLVVSFLVVLGLNAYVCPYRAKVRELLPGTALTVVAWTGALLGFQVYLLLGNVGRLYGALSAIIVAMLWLYVLMICFVAGVAINSERVTSRKEKKF